MFQYVSYFTQFVIHLSIFINLHSTVGPMIEIQNPVIYAANGTNATLECKVKTSFINFFLRKLNMKIRKIRKMSHRSNNKMQLCFDIHEFFFRLCHTYIHTRTKVLKSQ